MNGPSFAFGEVPVVASVHSSQRATPDEIVGIAEALWKAVKASGVGEADEAGNDELLARLQAENPDFNHSFPLVLRWMVQARQFSSRALRKYLRAHAAADLSTREGFLRLQAEYLVLLFREANPRSGEGPVQRYREALVKQLLAEDKDFLELQEKVEADLAEQAKEIDADRRQKLYQFLLAQRVAREGAVARAPEGPQLGASPGI